MFVHHAPAGILLAVLSRTPPASLEYVHLLVCHDFVSCTMRQQAFYWLADLLRTPPALFEDVCSAGVFGCQCQLWTKRLYRHGGTWS